MVERYTSSYLVTIIEYKVTLIWQQPNNGPVHKGVNRIPKAISDRDSNPFLIWKPDFTLCERKALSNQAFEMQKKGYFGSWSTWKAWFWGLVNAKLFRNVICACAFWKFVLKPCMGQSVNQRSIGTEYYLAVRRSSLWSGAVVEICLWMHIVQIKNPIRKRIVKRIVIRNGFQNMIRSFVNRPNGPPHVCDLQKIICC